MEKLNKTELLALMRNYSEYVVGCDGVDRIPVSLEEFYENEYQEGIDYGKLDVLVHMLIEYKREDYIVEVFVGQDVMDLETRDELSYEKEDLLDPDEYSDYLESKGFRRVAFESDGITFTIKDDAVGNIGTVRFEEL